MSAESRIQDNVASTKTASELNERAKQLTVDIFSGNSTVAPTDVYNQMATTPNMPLQNCVLLAESNVLSGEERTGIATSYMYAQKHNCRPVKEGEKGTSIITTRQDKDGNEKYVVSAYFDSTQCNGEALPRLLPHCSKANNNEDYIETMRTISGLLYSKDQTMKEIANYIFDKHFEPTYVVEFKNYDFDKKFDANQINADSIEAFKDKNFEEIADVLDKVKDNAEKAINHFTSALETDVNSIDQYQDAILFNDKFVLYSDDPKFKNGKQEVPLGMYAYEVYTKNGEEFIAKKTPRDGKYKGYVLSPTAIPYTDKRGIRTGNSLNIIDNVQLESINGYKTMRKDDSLDRQSFYNNNYILRNNESLTLQKPSDHLRLYSVYKDGKMIGAGYIDKKDVPHSEEEALGFKNVADIAKDADTVIFNCEGAFSGVQNGVAMGKTDLASFVKGRRESVKAMNKTEQTKKAPTKATKGSPKRTTKRKSNPSL